MTAPTAFHGVILPLFAATVVFGSGCATGPSDGVPREIKAVLNAPVPRTVSAVNRAFDAMGLRKTGQKRIPAAGSRPEVRRLLALDKTDQNVVIVIKPSGPHKTHISVRVGAGDLARSRAILDQVKRRL